MIAREKRTLKLTRTDVYHIILAALLVWFGNRMFGRKISDYLDHVGLEVLSRMVASSPRQEANKVKEPPEKGERSHESGHGSEFR